MKLEASEVRRDRKSFVAAKTILGFLRFAGVYERISLFAAAAALVSFKVWSLVSLPSCCHS